MFLTGFLQGHEWEALYNFADHDKSEEVSDNLKCLMLLNTIGKHIERKFNGLAYHDDWELLYEVLTINYMKHLMETTGETWDTEEVPPCNFNDLVWKTKVRFLSMHPIGLADIEGQKRTTAFTCSMMGILPTTTISSCQVEDNAVKIPPEINDCLDGDLERAVLRAHNLMHNQKQKFPFKIGSLYSKKRYKFNGPVKVFYSQYSAYKADAAAKVQTRSWKDIALFLCDSQETRSLVFPADFNRPWMTRLEMRARDNRKLKPRLALDNGQYIWCWAEECKQGLLELLHTQRHSQAVIQVMPKDKPCDSLEEFVAALDLTAKKKGTIWGLARHIPVPRPIHLLVYLVFLLGPAQAESDSQNTGLDDLSAVVQSNGSGIRTEPEPCFIISDPDYEQKVRDPIDIIPTYHLIYHLICISSDVSPPPAIAFRVLSFQNPNPEFRVLSFQNPNPEFRVLSFLNPNPEFRVLSFLNPNPEINRVSSPTMIPTILHRW
jgi:hypothetical protein